jgi:tetratricopeptide (TPR) repeat protein
MADVFISYSSEDRERVRPLAQALQGKGFSVWWDRSLGAGDDYAAVIARELDQAKAVVVVWSANSNASPWVRDEASRARLRLVPVLLDKVDIPIGFGTLHTEDLSAWNGSASAPEIAILAESIRARIEGRAVDTSKVQVKRGQAKVNRLVSTLATVGGLLALVGLGFGAVRIWTAPQVEVTAPQADALAQLLKLVEEGKISGEQAVALAKLLQSEAFADVPAAPTPTAAEKSNEPASIGTMQAPSLSADVAAAAEVSPAQVREAAMASFSDAAAALLQDPDKRVRAAVVKASRPATRQQGLQEMWDLAKEGGRNAAAIYRACGAMMAMTGDPRADQALQRASALNPQDKQVWRLLSGVWKAERKPEQAAGAALVASGLDAASEGDTATANVRLQAALPLVQEAPAQAFVLGQLGDQAAAQNDWQAAEAHYRDAVRLHRAKDDLAAISVDASKLARTLVQQGQFREACQTLTRAAAEGAAVTAEEREAACKAPPQNEALQPLRERPSTVLRERPVIQPPPAR